jgi:hypothetical protein
MSPATRENERVHAVTVDDGEFDVLIERRC